MPFTKEYYQKNQEKIKQYQKEYREKNKEKSKEYQKEYREENKDKINLKHKKYNYKEYQKEYIKERRHCDPLFKLNSNINSLIYNSFKNKNYKKLSKSELILGCTFEEFKNHLESKFESWMTWDNYGKYNGELSYGWDVDHIIPISSAITKEDILRLNHYTNLQPLCSKINRYIKKNKKGMYH
jgi:hypothetical protein